MSKKFNSFRFSTNKVAAVMALLPKLRELGRDTSIVDKLPDDVIAKGVTLTGASDGSIGVMYSPSRDAYTRLDDLLVILKSDNFSLSS